MPSVSKPQSRLMAAACKGDTRSKVPRSVACEFLEADRARAKIAAYQEGDRMNYFVLENACQDQIKKAAGAITARRVAVGVGAATLAGGSYAAMRKDGPVRKVLDGAGVSAFKKRWGNRKR